MQTNKILSASLIDLIFDGHNKDYGAYELRKNYSKRISRALLITLTIAALICSGVILASVSKKNKNVLQVGPEISLEKLDEKKPEPLPEQEKPIEKQQVKTEPFTALEIVPDEKYDEPPPTQEVLDLSKVGTEKIAGPSDSGLQEPVGPVDKKGIIRQDEVPVSDEPFRTVEVDARYMGNWVAFLERTLNANVPVDNSAPQGRYSVVVEFVVDKEGAISNVVALTNHGYGMEAEAIRAIKKTKAWEPAIQNGHKVKAYKRQVIVFEINEE